MSKRMKTMELLAFLCVACLLAVEKDGMVRVAVRRGRPKSKNASKLLAADGRITALPNITYTPEVTTCQGPKWETLFAGGG
jgi:hypothetical protein